MAEITATLVILDMDGVLLDLTLDTEAVRAAIRALFAAKGIKSNFVPLLRSLNAAVERVGQEQGKAEGTRIRAAAWAIIDDEEARSAGRCRPVPGVHHFLKRLSGARLALFTNNAGKAARRALERVGIDCGVFCAMQTRKGPEPIKPAADPVLHILNGLPPPTPHHVYLLGDHPTDMQSAVLARDVLPTHGYHCQLTAVALKRGRHAAADHHAAGADHLATTLEQAAEIILGAS